MLRGVAFVKMDATLHRRDGDIPDFTDYQAAGVADGGGAREAGDFFVGDASGFGEFVGEGAQAGAQHQRDFRAQARFRQDEFRGAVGAGEFGIARGGFGFSRAHRIMIPTMEADIKLAMVPVSMARMPRRARSAFLLGARAPMPPI